MTDLKAALIEAAWADCEARAKVNECEEARCPRREPCQWCMSGGSGAVSAFLGVLAKQYAAKQSLGLADLFECLSGDVGEAATDCQKIAKCQNDTPGPHRKKPIESKECPVRDSNPCYSLGLPQSWRNNGLRCQQGGTWRRGGKGRWQGGGLVKSSRLRVGVGGI